MSNYCVGCGAHRAGGQFCPECGRAVASQPSSTADGSTVSSSGERSPARGPLRLRQHPLAIVAAIAAVVAVLGIGAFAVNAQVRSAEQEAATRLAQQQTHEAEGKAAAERKRKQRAKAKARAEAKARARAEQESPDVVVVTPPPSAYNGPIDGDWSGTMADGKYTFWMTLSEYGGSVTGEIYQQDTRNGEEGVEVVEGYRDGGVLHLNGTWWRYAPPEWSLDQLVMTMSADGGSFTGTYTCDACAPSNPISGYRQ